ncbi:MAG TPA: DedA family protein [Rubrobacteraceae bacterium]|nr:DedA family protein [Rubrobacteraceae bacterium]
MGDLLASLAQLATDFVEYSGYIGVFVLVLLGNLHLPVPTQLTLPLAGFLIEQGQFTFVSVMVSSTAAAVAVSLFFYYVGLWIGEENLRRFVGRFGRFLFVGEKDLDKASKVFDRHGGKAILIGHFVPGVGAFISIPAGLRHMPISGRFMIYTIIGCILWNGAHVGLGWALGSQWTLVKQYVSIIEYAVVAAMVAAIVWFVWRRWKARG